MPNTTVMLHRDSRYAGAVRHYIEHCAGVSPVFTITGYLKRHRPPGRVLPGVKTALDRQGLRVHYDNRNESGYKIREAQLQQVPYMLIIGDKRWTKTVSVRLRDGSMMNFMSFDEFRNKLRTNTKRNRWCPCWKMPRPPTPQGKAINKPPFKDRSLAGIQGVEGSFGSGNNFPRPKERKRPVQHQRLEIRAKEACVVGPDGKMLGVYPTMQALQLARFRLT